MKIGKNAGVFLAIFILLMTTVLAGCNSSLEKEDGDENNRATYTGDPVEAVKTAATKTKELDNYKLSIVTEWLATEDIEQEQNCFDVYTGSDGVMSILSIEQEYVKSNVDAAEEYYVGSHCYYHDNVAISIIAEEDATDIGKAVSDKSFTVADAVYHETGISQEAVKKGLENLYGLNLQAYTNDAGEIFIEAKNLDMEKFIAVYTSVTGKLLRDTYVECDFAIALMVNADGYLTSFRFDIGDMPIKKGNIDEKIKWSYTISISDIGLIAPIEKPAWTSLPLVRLEAIEEEYTVSYNYDKTWGGLNMLSMESHMETIEQYIVPAEVAGYPVKYVMGASGMMSKPYSITNIVIPKGAVTGFINNVTNVFFEDSKDVVKANYNALIGNDFEKAVEHCKAVFYYAGQWEYVEGVATPK